MGGTSPFVFQARVVPAPGADALFPETGFDFSHERSLGPIGRPPVLQEVFHGRGPRFWDQGSLLFFAVDAFLDCFGRVHFKRSFQGEHFPEEDGKAVAVTVVSVKRQGGEIVTVSSAAYIMQGKARPTQSARRGVPCCIVRFPQGNFYRAERRAAVATVRHCSGTFGK